MKFGDLVFSEQLIFHNLLLFEIVQYHCETYFQLILS